MKGVLIGYGHDSHGRAKTQRTAGGATATLGYDSISRVNQINHDFNGSARDLTLGFAYNPAGQLVEQNFNNGHFVHQGQTGQIGTYSVNGLNQYTAIDGAVNTHDDNGNLKSDGVNTYTYDVENRLTQVQGAYNASLHYDPMGRLYKVSSSDTGVTSYFLYSGDAMIAEYQNGQMTKRYVHDGGALAPRISYEGTANRRFLHANHQGSVIARTDNSGAVTNINTYNEYGVPGAGNAGRFSYTGQVHLPEVGLYYYRARMYDPMKGRFLQTDPVGYEDQMNLYAYVGNDPLNGVDPTGMYSCSTNGNTKTCEGTQDEVDAMTGEMKGYQVTSATDGFGIDSSNVMSSSPDGFSDTLQTSSSDMVLAQNEEDNSWEDLKEKFKKKQWDKFTNKVCSDAESCNDLRRNIMNALPLQMKIPGKPLADKIYVDCITVMNGDAQKMCAMPE